MLNYKEIEEAADRFRSKFAINGIPVEVEQVIEGPLNIDIVPVNRLKRDFNIAGCLAGDRSILCVDQRTLDEAPEWYRFTLAHEIAHLELHGEVYEQNKITSIDDYRNWLEKLPREQSAVWESEADDFAQCLLIPREEATARFREREQFAIARGATPGTPELRAHLIKQLSRFFGLDVVIVRSRIDKLNL